MSGKIIVNGIVCVAPESVALPCGAIYSYPEIQNGKADFWTTVWNDRVVDLARLSAGLIYLNSEQALQRAEAMLNFSTVPEPLAPCSICNF